MNKYNAESRTHGAYTQIYLATLNFLPSNTCYANTFCSHCTEGSFDGLRDVRVVEEMARTYRDQRASHRQRQVVVGESCNFNLRLQFLRDAVRRKTGDTWMKLTGKLKHEFYSLRGRAEYDKIVSNESKIRKLCLNKSTMTTNKSNMGDSKPNRTKRDQDRSAFYSPLQSR